jgi:hypothetical protein
MKSFEQAENFEIVHSDSLEVADLLELETILETLGRFERMFRTLQVSIAWEEKHTESA